MGDKGSGLEHYQQKNKALKQDKLGIDKFIIMSQSTKN